MVSKFIPHAASRVKNVSLSNTLVWSMTYFTAGQTKIRDPMKLARKRILHDVLPKIIMV